MTSALRLTLAPKLYIPRKVRTPESVLLSGSPAGDDRVLYMFLAGPVK